MILSLLQRPPLNDRGVSSYAGKMTKEDKRHTLERRVVYCREIGHIKQFPAYWQKEIHGTEKYSRHLTGSWVILLLLKFVSVANGNKRL